MTTKKFFDPDGVGLSSESIDWFTPEPILACVYQVLGELALDPCANKDSTVKARHYYSLTNGCDGLTDLWFGPWFCNPPYRRYVIDRWVEKAAKASTGQQLINYEQEHGIMLIPARTDTLWFCDWVWPYADVVLWKGRIKFDCVGAKKQVAPFPSAVALYSCSEELRAKFKEVFGPKGRYIAKETP